jgi:putative CocE/NonD family hydrolase
MPDGIRLYADHYVPKAAGEHPTILIRTPYGRGREAGLMAGYPLAELPAQRFAEQGYHVIVQGARGCYDSEGEFVPHLHEAADGQATVEWISRQPWFNGVLGTWGPSYLGYMQWATSTAAPNSLQAMVIMIASAENHSVSYPDGAFGLETRLRWTQGMRSQAKKHRMSLGQKIAGRFGEKDEDRLQTAFDHLPLETTDMAACGEPVPFFRDILNHCDPRSKFWNARDHSADLGKVSAPIHLIGGWYDYYLRGLLRDYSTLRAAGRQPHLTIGPWAHAQAGALLTGLCEAPAWFDAHLKGASGTLREKPVRIFVMGDEEWREMDAFPPKSEPIRFYLQPESLLSTSLPPSSAEPDRYRYDPTDPTPSIGGAILAFRGAGAQDNAALETRSDVLTYTSSSLEEAVEVIGLVRLELYVKSSLPYTDFFGRLCDVSPEGKSTNLCDGLFRLKPGLGEPQPSGCLRVEVDMWATAHRFLPGHSIRLQVSSGAHPRWSRNLGTGEPLAMGTGMQPSDQAVFHDQSQPSALILPVVAA